MLMHERDEDTLILRGTTLFDVHMYTHSSASQNAYLCNGRARSSLIGNAVCISCTHRLHSCKHCLQLIHTPSATHAHAVRIYAALFQPTARGGVMSCRELLPFTIRQLSVCALQDFFPFIAFAVVIYIIYFLWRFVKWSGSFQAFSLRMTVFFMVRKISPRTNSATPMHIETSEKVIRAWDAT